VPPTRITFLYSGLRVRNLARSLAFYRRLGFRVRSRGKMSHGGVWVQLLFPGSRHRLELNYYPPANRFYEPLKRGTEFDHLGFWVPDVEAWERSLRRRRIPIVARIREPAEHENIVYVRDPDGNWIEYFGPVPG
jgi:catechol 2,3-dioxygenase-like lactoylglutathione lyase family enzyme